MRNKKKRNTQNPHPIFDLCYKETCEHLIWFVNSREVVLSAIGNTLFVLCVCPLTMFSPHEYSLFYYDFSDPKITKNTKCFPLMLTHETFVVYLQFVIGLKWLYSVAFI